MVDRTNPFAILRKTTYKLDDLSRFLPSHSYKMYSDERRSRAETKHNWTPDSFGKTRHQSLVSMRTYYAFGARSHSIATPISSYRTPLYNSYSYVDNSSRFPSISSTYDSYRSIPRSVTSSYVPTAIRNSTSSARIPGSSYRPSTSYPSTYSTKTSAISRCSSGYMSCSSIASSYSKPTSTYVPTPRKEFKLPRAPRLSISPPPAPINEETPSISLDIPKVEMKSAYSQMSPHCNVVQKIDQATSSSLENLSVNTEELEDLQKKNKNLEEEVSRLKLQLKDKERTEHEMRRKLLECEAETKVWRTKCEHIQPTIQINETTLDSTLIDQLDHAADKLAKLNVAHDLKMLQSEMESALMEIAK